MTKWEYNVLDQMISTQELQAKLSEQGALGWELVYYSYHNGYAIAVFKRPQE
jgi:hypothetical protein